MSVAGLCTRWFRRGWIPSITAAAAIAAPVTPLSSGLDLAGLTSFTTPSITSVMPASGPVQGGTRVVILGSHFLGPANVCAGTKAVYFGANSQYGNPMPATDVQFVSDNEIVAFAPPDFGGGVHVQIHNSCGTSQPSSVADYFTYTYPGECIVGTCTLSVDGGTMLGSVDHVAEGFNEGYNDPNRSIPPSVPSMIDALHPQSWRLGAGLGQNGLFDLARGSGAKVSALLETDWLNAGGTSKPWLELPVFYQFVAQDVRNRELAGTAPDYWDIWNEPNDDGTVNQYLALYQAAYNAIKAASSTAKVVGPSISYFLTEPPGNGNVTGHALDLTTFASFAANNNLKFDAISYHEDGTLGPPGVSGVPMDGYTPDSLSAHVRELRSLLASYPALGSPQIFVNEEGPTYATLIPGWMVGSFASLESAGAGGADLTCMTQAECNDLMDGLFTLDGTPQMPYWVLDAYAQLTGERLATNSSETNLSALATRNDATSQVQVLVGRHDDCGPPPRAWVGAGPPNNSCPEFQPPQDAPISLSVSVKEPFALSSVRVTAAPLPNSAMQPDGSDPVPSPPPAFSTTLPVVNGVVTVPPSSMGDGDALMLTLAPAS